ncbi:MAG TPA: hypothetical protein PLR83_08020 [Pyrinomonadaceae bacterium]|nr:hypothetical protein [Pyrinomonadaceae bacterium]
MLRILLCIFALLTVGLTFSCSSAPAKPGSASDSPTEAYKRLFVAVKAKNTDQIKAEMTKATQQFAGAAAEKYKKPIEQVFENGFTGTTFAESMPPIRDERVDGDMGAVEVWNSKDSRWEDLPFMKEDGAWKLAVGNIYQGSYKSPGPGRDQREKMAANSAGQHPVEMPQPNMNSNVNVVKVPMPVANKQPSANEGTKPKTAK